MSTHPPNVRASHLHSRCKSAMRPAKKQGSPGAPRNVGVTGSAYLSQDADLVVQTSDISEVHVPRLLREHVVDHGIDFAGKDLDDGHGGIVKCDSRTHDQLLSVDVGFDSDDMPWPGRRFDDELLWGDFLEHFADHVSDALYGFELVFRFLVVLLQLLQLKAELAGLALLLFLVSPLFQVVLNQLIIGIWFHACDSSSSMSACLLQIDLALSSKSFA